MKELEKRREERYNEEKRREVSFCLFVAIADPLKLHTLVLDSVSQQWIVREIFTNSM